MIRPLLLLATLAAATPAFADPSNPGSAPLSPSMDRTNQPSRTGPPVNAPSSDPKDQDSPTVAATQPSTVAGPPLPNGTPVTPDGRRAVPPKR